MNKGLFCNIINCPVLPELHSVHSGYKPDDPFELKHINRHKPCAACEKMYLSYIKKLEKQIELLTKALEMKHLTEPIKVMIDKKI